MNELIGIVGYNLYIYMHGARILVSSSIDEDTKYDLINYGQIKEYSTVKEIDIQIEISAES